MNQDKKELLFSYIKVNIAPIIVDFISAQDIPNAVIIDAINNPDLFGHFVGTLYLPPEWFEKTNKNVNDFTPVLSHTFCCGTIFGM